MCVCVCVCVADMRLFFLLAVTLVSLCAVRGADKKKLQIGIKKRVENCPIKSRKGDVLNMHYTVSAMHCLQKHSLPYRTRPRF